MQIVKNRSKKNIIFLLVISLLLTSCGRSEKTEEPEQTAEVIDDTIEQIIEQDPKPDPLSLALVSSVPEGGWIMEATFPDRNDDISTTLAMNSMASFKGYHGQGEAYVTVGDDIEAFKMYVNEREVDTSGIVSGGVYKLDYSEVALDGINTLQVSGVEPFNAKSKVKVNVSYPSVLDGTFGEAGISEDAISLIEDIIESDIEYGFTSAQLAVIRNGRFVYNDSWGRVNSYLPDGTRDATSPMVTDDTLYDLASVTKMFATNYAIQKLVTDGELDLDSPVTDYFGDGFVEDTLDIKLAGAKKISIDTQKKWKSALTVRDILKHQGGFPASPRYCKPTDALYAGNDGSDQTREATRQAICKTPLIYEPGTQTLYSDVDFMILGFIVEKISGQRLDEYVKENFYEPMGLTHITFNPLENGFGTDDCAATELNGNTRDGKLYFDGIRTDTIRGEVHDELAYYCMGGVSGHAGLFSNASDLARLASVMLTGGYENNRFFSIDVMDTFTSPKNENEANWGLGWWRKGDDIRTGYFSTYSVSSAIGHQGWTGTLVVIDPERDLVIAYLTNKINSPVTDKEKNTALFDGGGYTASTLGFVTQIISIGMDSDEDIEDQLMSLLEEMTYDSFRIVDAEHVNDPDYPRVKNVQSKLAVYKKRALESGKDEYIKKADELVSKWEQYKLEANESPVEDSDEVILGDEQFDEYVPLLNGKRVAVFSNQTGIVGDDLESNKHVVDALIERQVNVTAIFSPEHGFRGQADAGANVSDSVDDKTGVPILSLYANNTRYPSDESMDKFDTLIVDIQDVGLRYYTYYITMCDLMDACAKNGKNVIILDRPNPNGFYVDGPILKDEFRSGVGRLPIPVVHGMTLGEMARMINGQGWLTAGKDSCDLTVIPCKNYTHDIKSEVVIDPSPNLKSMRAIYLYASTCFFENTAVSVGRGTDNPFEIFGSPYLSGVESYDYTFVPQSMSGANNPMFEGQTCYGRDLRDIPLENIFEAGINPEYLIDAYNDMKIASPDVDFFGKVDSKGYYWVDYLFGTDEIRNMIVSGKSASEIKSSWQTDVESFKESRKPYLIYE
ncbi:MAG: penicillin binding protein PBP4B [Lachnospiraceae bacterium]|nr:penicillin binding protein PBP4B [Lachnospiraceae bacterium]